jgi:hypothetical protein
MLRRDIGVIPVCRSRRRVRKHARQAGVQRCKIVGDSETCRAAYSCNSAIPVGRPAPSGRQVCSGGGPWRQRDIEGQVSRKTNLRSRPEAALVDVW